MVNQHPPERMAHRSPHTTADRPAPAMGRGRRRWPSTACCRWSTTSCTASPPASSAASGPTTRCRRPPSSTRPTCACARCTASPGPAAHQFFGFAAHLMRRILVEHARRRGRAKRGGGLPAGDPGRGRRRGRPAGRWTCWRSTRRSTPWTELDSRKATVVELRFFGGLTVEETAAVLGISAETVGREWRRAKAWLFEQLSVGAEEARPRWHMELERWSQLDALFAAALEQPPEERAAFLDAACAATPSCASRSSACSPPTRAPAPSSSAGPAPDSAREAAKRRGRPAALGPYRLRAGDRPRRHGHGLPRDPRRRPVRAPGRGQAAARRLAATRGAASASPPSARSSPASSTPTSPGSTTAASRETGVPYLVMELVDGLPIDDYCDRQRLDHRRAPAPLPAVCSTRCRTRTRTSWSTATSSRPTSW